MFTLHVTYSNTLSHVSVRVSTYSVLRQLRGPAGIDGTALATPFSFKAQFWQDDQFPLTYSLGYLSASK
jgi:hypothetical protein